MSTRPLDPPPFIADDPGPWSVVTQLVRSRGGRPGRRYAEPPRGLMLAQPPRIDVALPGLDEGLDTLGAGAIRIVAAAREPAHGLSFADQDTLVGVSPAVRRTWSIPDLAPTGEERPETDPAAELPAPVAPQDVASDVPGVATSPDGALEAVSVLEGTRAAALVVRRASDRAVVRWIRGAMAAAWSPDGDLLAIGGDWGVLLAGAAPTED